jgi:hypothetical protein
MTPQSNGGGYTKVFGLQMLSIHSRTTNYDVKGMHLGVKCSNLAMYGGQKLPGKDIELVVLHWLENWGWGDITRYQFFIFRGKVYKYTS